MSNDFVTGVAAAASRSVTLTCQGASGADAKPARAARLEDVKKFVRSHDLEIAYLLEVVLELEARIADLEDMLGRMDVRVYRRD